VQQNLCKGEQLPKFNKNATQIPGAAALFVGRLQARQRIVAEEINLETMVGVFVEAVRSVTG
jgi:hypothetical protein